MKYFMIAFLLLMVMTIGCDNKDAIQQEIDNANYCETKDDCASIGTKCPFGCYIYVNTQEADRIEELVYSYDSNCVYDCVYCPDVACVGGRCEPVCEN